LTCILELRVVRVEVLATAHDCLLSAHVRLLLLADDLFIILQQLRRFLLVSGLVLCRTVELLRSRILLLLVGNARAVL
jgi:hypothetical protein